MWVGAAKNSWFSTVRTDKFLVVRPDHFDVVIGVEAIARMNFLLMKDSVFMEPMIAYSKVTLGQSR